MNRLRIGQFLALSAALSGPHVGFGLPETDDEFEARHEREERQARRMRDDQARRAYNESVRSGKSLLAPKTAAMRLAEMGTDPRYAADRDALAKAIAKQARKNQTRLAQAGKEKGHV